MRFYGQDDDEHDEDEMEEFFDEDGTGEELEEMLNEDFRELKLAELGLVSVELKQRLLQDTLTMLERTFLWKFLPYQTKLNRIAETYAVFARLISQE